MWLAGGNQGLDLLAFEEIGGGVYVHGVGPNRVPVDVTLTQERAATLKNRAVVKGYREVGRPTEGYLNNWFYGGGR